MKKEIMNSKIKGKSKGLSLGPIQKRILGITISGIIFVCLIIGVISLYIFRNYLQDSMVATTKTSLSNLNESINIHVDNVYRMARYCQGSQDIATYIEASPMPGSVLSVATYDRLYEEYQGNESNTYIPRVVVIAGDNYLQACVTAFSTTTNLAKAVPELPFFDELISSDTYNYQTGIIKDPFVNGRPKLVVPVIRPITYKFNSNQIGYLYMEFSADLFINQMNRYYLDEGSVLHLVMGDHIYRYESGMLIEEASDYFSLEETLPKDLDVLVNEVKVGDVHRTVVTVPTKLNGCYLVQTVSPATLKNEQRSFFIMLLAVLASVIAIGVAMALSLNHFIHKPLNILRKKISLVSAGDFSRDPSIEWPHELGEIGKGINDLSESVNNLLNARLEDEKQKRDLEYQMLQSQINPHFLYNTLNSIKMMATIQGATGISEMTTALASLLRSISKGTSLLVPISEELSLVNDYFIIQNYRYGGMIGFNIDVKDPEINKSQILKFTLQPLVENAIFHGLEPKGGTGNINITLDYKESEINPGTKDIVIEVLDDGVGITEEKIQDIMKGSSVDNKADFFKEIGISNVHNRLRYEFGEGYGIFIESVVGSYTKMIVIIPENNKETP